jgi:transcriptional regulator with XRE-family HTH domain
MIEKQTFGVRLREERKRLGLSQDDMAMWLSVSRSSVAFYEADRTVPGIDCMVRAAEAGVDVWYLMFATRGAENAVNLMDWDLLEAITRSVREWAQVARLELPIEKELGITRLLYRQFAKTRKIDPGYLQEAMRLVA